MNVKLNWLNSVSEFSPAVIFLLSIILVANRLFDIGIYSIVMAGVGGFLIVNGLARCSFIAGLSGFAVLVVYSIWMDRATFLVAIALAFSLFAGFWLGASIRNQFIAKNTSAACKGDRYEKNLRCHGCYIEHACPYKPGGLLDQYKH